MDEEFAAQAESARLRFEADMRRQEEEQRAKAQAERETRYKQLVREALKDPDSAQFRNIRFVQGGSVMCGEVNAKNGFGGYAGFTSFVVDEKRGAYIASGDLKGWPMPIETEYGCR